MGQSRGVIRGTASGRVEGSVDSHPTTRLQAFSLSPGRLVRPGQLGSGLRCWLSDSKGGGSGPRRPPTFRAFRGLSPVGSWAKPGDPLRSLTETGRSGQAARREGGANKRHKLRQRVGEGDCWVGAPRCWTFDLVEASWAKRADRPGRFPRDEKIPSRTGSSPRWRGRASSGSCRVGTNPENPPRSS